jgi:hypothetical protein
MSGAKCSHRFQTLGAPEGKDAPAPNTRIVLLGTSSETREFIDIVILTSTFRARPQRREKTLQVSQTLDTRLQARTVFDEVKICMSHSTLSRMLIMAVSSSGVNSFELEKFVF